MATIDPAGTFEDVVSRADDALGVAEAALLIAREEYPGLGVPRYLRQLSALGRRFRTRISQDMPSADAADALSSFLSEEEGFHGNVDDYYDPRNSFLNDVLDRRMGIPITLGIVYVVVARTAGLQASGAGFPGHFLVRVDGEAGPCWIDAFNRGVRLGRKELRGRLDRIYGGRVALDETMLGPCGGRQILARVLRNLKGIYMKSGDYARALRASTLLLLVDASLEERRDHGLLLAAMDCYDLAANTLAQCVEEAQETRGLERTIAELRRKAARVN